MTTHCGPETSISNEDLLAVWATTIGSVLEDAENAEAGLSYAQSCTTEHARRLTGSYYTPVDVSRYFWNEFFRLRGINESVAAQRFLSTHRFVEPAVGAGALFFSFLEKLVIAGVHPQCLTAIRADLVDLNARALEFVKQQIGRLESIIHCKFTHIRYVHADFLACDYADSSEPLMIFGNPPFVANQKGASPWKNSFADFLEQALKCTGAMGSVHFIVPFSIAFSRDYSALRHLLTAGQRTVALSHFDNIPDTLFKSGKPKHHNTNKANSQRCSIVSATLSASPVVLSTRLNRWSKSERRKILATPAEYFDVTDCRFDKQIVRPRNHTILKYISRNVAQSKVIADYVSDQGEYALHVAGVARNYIGIRESASASVNTLVFSNKHDFFRVFRIVTSDVFLDYWLTIGDGFHVTKKNIMGFPMGRCLLKGIDSNVMSVAELWKTRRRHMKLKRNSGALTQSYDFTAAGQSLYPLIEADVCARMDTQGRMALVLN